MDDNKVITPINLDATLFKKDLIMREGKLLGIFLIIAEIIFIFAFIIPTYLSNRDSRNIQGGIVLIIISMYIVTKVIRVFVLREKVLKRIYTDIKKGKGVKVASAINSYTYEKTKNNITLFLTKNGLRVAILKLHSDSLVGSDNEDDIKRHDLAVADALKELRVRFGSFIILSIMDKYTVDKRWDSLEQIVSKSNINVLKKMVLGLAEHNMRTRGYAYNTYYIIAEPTAYRASTKMANDLMKCAKKFMQAKYRGYEFLTETAIDEILKNVYGVDISFKNLLEDYDDFSKARIELVRVCEVTYTNNETIKLRNTFEEDIELREKIVKGAKTR